MNWQLKEEDIWNGNLCSFRNVFTVTFDQFNILLGIFLHKNLFMTPNFWTIVYVQDKFNPMCET